MKVINWKHRTEFYWADCTHKLNSDEHTDCPYCRIAELEAALIEAEHDWEQERRNFRELQATIKQVLGELTVLTDWIHRGFSADDAATEIKAIVERESGEAK